jgi:Protein of unknown function (DUF1629)
MSEATSVERIDNTANKRPKGDGYRRKFFTFNIPYDTPASGWKLVNPEVFDPTGIHPSRIESIGDNIFLPASGFGNTRKRPRDQFRPTLGLPRFVIPNKTRHPKDFESMAGNALFLLSERCKQVIEAVDPHAMAFIRCVMQLADGTSFGDYWAGSVVREIDAVDEQYSKFQRITQKADPTVWGYSGPGGVLYFKEKVVGAAHLFAMAHSSKYICDEQMRNALKAAGIKGLSMDDARKW